jgi:hypothetical protein
MRQLTITKAIKLNGAAISKTTMTIASKLARERQFI